MSEILISLQQLRGMIGLHVIHQGLVCRVIEVLEDGPALVLARLEQTTTIQSNQYGEANRRVPHTHTIPVLNPERDELHPLFLRLELLE